MKYSGLVLVALAAAVVLADRFKSKILTGNRHYYLRCVLSLVFGTYGIQYVNENLRYKYGVADVGVWFPLLAFNLINVNAIYCAYKLYMSDKKEK